MVERDRATSLWNIVAELPRELHSMVARIRNKILPTGELDDRASPELARIRHEIARLRSHITRSLENLMRRSEEAIQDELVTVRNDRFVIPVRSDHRARIQGVAHGFSSSGATVFVEPMETIDANNELQALQEMEQQEIAQDRFSRCPMIAGATAGVGIRLPGGRRTRLHRGQSRLSATLQLHCAGDRRAETAPEEADTKSRGL
jgi:dsDNA-specific endonuclease/ATPase MutS2